MLASTCTTSSMLVSYCLISELNILLDNDVGQWCSFSLHCLHMRIDWHRGNAIGYCNTFLTVISSSLIFWDNGMVWTTQVLLCQKYMRMRLLGPLCSLMKFMGYNVWIFLKIFMCAFFLMFILYLVVVNHYSSCMRGCSINGS